MSLIPQIREQIDNAQSNLDGFSGDFGNGLPELYVNLIIGFTLLEAGLIGQEDLIQALTNEITSRVQVDTQLAEGLNLTNERINNLLYDPLPDSNIKNGSRLYLDEFIEVFSTDQVDGLNQKFALFTNALSGKLSGISANPNTGISFDLLNPSFPVITQNRPLWDNIQNKPVGIQLTNQKGQANGYASLDSNSKIPISQLPNVNSSLQIVANITERNALVLTGNTPVLVIDASDDPNVNSGHAFYVYDFANTTWIKTSEQESLDLILDWINIQNKPTEFNPTPHGHTIANISGLQAILDSISNPDWSSVGNKPATFTPSTHSHIINDITGLQTALNGKRNTGNIPAAEITEDGTREFVTSAQKSRWNNELYDFATVTASPSFFAFGLYNSFKVTLGGNITVNINSPRSGQVYVIKFIQDSTGGRTVTLPGNCIVATGESIETGANKKSLLTLHYDGTEFLCSWKKGF